LAALDAAVVSRAAQWVAGELAAQRAKELFRELGDTARVVTTDLLPPVGLKGNGPLWWYD